jgi:hypothetical protein
VTVERLLLTELFATRATGHSAILGPVPDAGVMSIGHKMDKNLATLSTAATSGSPVLQSASESAGLSPTRTLHIKKIKLPLPVRLLASLPIRLCTFKDITLPLPVRLLASLPLRLCTLKRYKASAASDAAGLSPTQTLHIEKV